MDYGIDLDPDVAKLVSGIATNQQPTKYDSMFDDLVNQIENLPDDPDDDGPAPDLNQLKRGTGQKAVTTNQKGNGGAKLANFDADDLEKAINMMGPGGDDDEDDDFGEEVKMETNHGHPAKKINTANVDDLESMINNMEGGDDDDDDDEAVSKPSAPKGRPQQQPQQQQSHKQPAAKPTQKTTSTQQNTQQQGVPFPICCFLGVAADRAIQLEDKLHNANTMFSFKVMDYEVRNIIEPCLANPGISDDIKKMLTMKKAALIKQRERFEDMLKSKKLNAKTFPPIIEKGLKDHESFLQVAIKSGLKNDAQRIQIRQKIIQDDLEDVKSKMQGVASHKVARQIDRSEKTVERRTNTTAKDKPLAEYAEDTDSTKFFKDYENMSKRDQLRLLKARKAQYFNLAMYLKKEVSPFIPKEEQAKLIARISKQYLPLIQKVNDIIKAMEEGGEDDASEFLAEELVEVTPSELHGMSLAERSQKIRDIINKLEEAIANEEKFSQDLQKSSDKASSHAVGRKVTECKRRIIDYHKNIELIEKVEKDPWILVPRFTFATETRTIASMNPEIEPNIMIVEFKCLTKCSAKQYYLKYGLNANSKWQQFQTNKCDTNGIWNYSQHIQLTPDPKTPNRDIWREEMNVQLYGTGFFSDHKKGENKISFANFQKENTIRGQLVMNQQADRYSAEYVIRIREPMNKFSKQTITTAIIEKVFPKVDINAKLPEPKNPPSTNTSQTKSQPNQTQQPQQQSTQQPQAQPQTQAQPQSQSQPQHQGLPANPNPLVLLKSAIAELKGMFQASDVPEGCTPEDIMEPDDATRNKCYTYLQELSNQLESAKNSMMSGGLGSVSESKYVRDKWSLAFKEFSLLENNLQAGNIDIEEYMKGLEDTIQKDKRLLQLYTSKNAAKYIVFITAKIGIYEKEVADTKAQMEAGEEEGEQE